MRLPTGDGVGCDACSLALRQDFTYYSCDIKRVPPRPTSRDELLRAAPHVSLDICENCHTGLTDQVTRNYRAVPPGVLRCDITGTPIKPGQAYYAVIAKVLVRHTGQPFICVKCQTQAVTSDQPCTKCKSEAFVQPGQTKVDDLHLELSLGEVAFQQIFTRMQATRQQMQKQEWSTRT